MKKDAIDLILKTLIIAGAVLVIYWILQIFFGHSPTISELNFGMIFVLTGFIINVLYRIARIEERNYFQEKNIEMLFSNMKRDIKEIKDGLKK